MSDEEFARHRFQRGEAERGDPIGGGIPRREQHVAPHLFQLRQHECSRTAAGHRIESVIARRIVRNAEAIAHTLQFRKRERSERRHVDIERQLPPDVPQSRERRRVGGSGLAAVLAEQRTPHLFERRQREREGPLRPAVFDQQIGAGGHGERKRGETLEPDNMQDVEPLEARQREGHRLRLRCKRRRIERQRSGESAAAQLRQLRCRNEPQRDGAVLRKGVFREIEYPGEARQVVEREVAADGRETRQQGAEIGDGGQRSQPHVALEPFDKRQVDRFDGRTSLDGERPGRGKPRQRDRPERRTVGQRDRPDGFDQRKLARSGQRKLLVDDRTDRSQRTEGRRELSQLAEACHGQLPADTLQFGKIHLLARRLGRVARRPREPHVAADRLQFVGHDLGERVRTDREGPVDALQRRENDRPHRRTAELQIARHLAQGRQFDPLQCLIRRPCTADAQRLAPAQSGQSRQILAPIGVRDRQVAAHRDQTGQSVQIHDRLAALDADREVAFDHIDPARGEGIHLGLRAQRQASPGRNVGTIDRVNIRAVALAVGADQKLPLLRPVPNRRRIGMDRRMFAQFVMHLRPVERCVVARRGRPPRRSLPPPSAKRP